uniref:HMG box domain-containing protein n=1 Tax=Timema cristinae TaxID=61476 RepID=A0A7R9H5S0_TIMCR|nr:unnamed protein product [Timema cristinae]
MSMLGKQLGRIYTWPRDYRCHWQRVVECSQGAGRMSECRQQCCQPADDCQPKDLSMKCNKKFKPIPPPLNLNTASNPLKDFANIATSPKSPLMQKNLPFRKRAHSLSQVRDTATHHSPIPSELPLRRLEEEEVQGHSPRQTSDLRSVIPAHCWSPTVSSVLLSPAPSSLGSSREELSAWPPQPVWHCFQPGSLLKIDCLHGGTSGVWRLAEDLKLLPDWLIALRLEHTEETDVGAITAAVYLSRPHRLGGRDNGAVPCSPRLLCTGQGFNFPPDESPLLPPETPGLLSPPVSPTKKCRDLNSDRPKRPMNAFMLFAKRYRLELIQSHPGKDNRAISVILGEAWKNLASAEKEVYVAEARSMAQEQKRLHPDCWKRKRSHSTS